MLIWAYYYNRNHMHQKVGFVLKAGNHYIFFPLVSAIKDGLLKRFRNSLNNLDFISASSRLPHFKLK